MAGIYVHIPFCTQSCYYCDFHFSTSKKTKKIVIDAIQQELIVQKKYFKTENVHTIYFGGGTPSSIDLDSIEGILNSINKLFKINKGVEITIEANPEDVSPKIVERWSSIGINRVSLGVQSLRNKDLKYMNRIHDKNQAMVAIDVLRSYIDNVSVDLIYGFPLLDNRSWLNNLEYIAGRGIQHVSCYCLTVEKNTPLSHFIKQGKYKSLDSELGKKQFLIARKFLIDNGYDHYEISNFSKPGFESKHNQNYWNRSIYLGVGPSAHSFNGRIRHWNISNNILYSQKISQKKIYYTEEKLTAKNIINEQILTGLRTKWGLGLGAIKHNINNKDWELFSRRVILLESDKLLKIKNNTIYLTEKGMLTSDSISANLFLI